MIRTLIALALSTALPTLAATLPAPMHWSQCAADDAECDAATEDDGDLCADADCVSADD